MEGLLQILLQGGPKSRGLALGTICEQRTNKDAVDQKLVKGKQSSLSGRKQRSSCGAGEIAPARHNGLHYDRFITAHAVRYGLFEAVILSRMIDEAREYADHFSAGEDEPSNPSDVYVFTQPDEYCSSFPYIDENSIRKAVTRLVRRGGRMAGWQGLSPCVPPSSGGSGANKARIQNSVGTGKLSYSHSADVVGLGLSHSYNDSSLYQQKEFSL